MRGKAKGNLAGSYSKLGRHEDALAMHERVLEFYRRVLPEDHPKIGEGCVGSGVACSLIFADFSTFLFSSPAPFYFRLTFFQPWLVKTSASAWSEPDLCLVLLKPRVKLCACGRQLCRLGTKIFQMLRSSYVGWSRPRIREGREEENRGRRSAQAQSVTIIKWGMKLVLCARAADSLQLKQTVGEPLSRV